MTDTLLKRALLANASFSILCSIGIFTFTSELSAIFAGIAPLYLQALGGGLFIFAVNVIWIARKSPIVLKEAKLVTIADWGWVAGSAILIAMTSDALSLLAIDIIIGIAVVVALFAIFQAKGMKRIQNENSDVGFSAS